MYIAIYLNDDPNMKIKYRPVNLQVLRVGGVRDVHERSALRELKRRSRRGWLLIPSSNPNDQII